LMMASVGFAANCFSIGASFTDGSTNPSLGVRRFALSEIQRTGRLSDLFVDQYNSVGFPFSSRLITVGNCITVIGSSVSCIRVAPGAAAAGLLSPYTLNGQSSCQWTDTTGNMRFGGYSASGFVSVTNALVNGWTNETCPTVDSRWTILYNLSCDSIVPPPPPPPVQNYTCCIYYNHAEKFESAFCQQQGFACPAIIGFVLVANDTIGNCRNCTTDLPFNAFSKYHIASELAHPSNIKTEITEAGPAVNKFIAEVKEIAADILDKVMPGRVAGENPHKETVSANPPVDEAKL